MRSHYICTTVVISPTMSLVYDVPTDIHSSMKFIVYGGRCIFVHPRFNICIMTHYTMKCFNSVSFASLL